MLSTVRYALVLRPKLPARVMVNALESRGAENTESDNGLRQSASVVNGARRGWIVI